MSDIGFATMVILASIWLCAIGLKGEIKTATDRIIAVIKEEK